VVLLAEQPSGGFDGPAGWAEEAGGTARPAGPAAELGLRALWAVALTLFLASVVQAVITHRSLYQDGGHHLVVLLQTRSPTQWFWARHFAQVLAQWPLVVALRAGLTDLEACITIQAAGLFYLTPLAVLLASSWRPATGCSSCWFSSSWVPTTSTPTSGSSPRATCSPR